MKLSVILISALAAIVAATSVDNIENDPAAVLAPGACKDPPRTDGDCAHCQKEWEKCMKELKCPGEPGGCAMRCNCMVSGIGNCQWPCKWFCC